MSFVLAFLAMLAIVGAMSVGVVFGRQPIRGSCGGLGALGIDSECKICGGDVARCAEVRPDQGGPGDPSKVVREFDPVSRERD